MLVVAKSKKGAEFFYQRNSARQVHKASAQKIADAMNRAKFEGLKDDEIWFVHEVNSFSDTAIIAGNRWAKVYKGKARIDR